MARLLTAIVKQSGQWWIGWVEEVQGVNRQKAIGEVLQTVKLSTLVVVLLGLNMFSLGAQQSPTSRDTTVSLELVMAEGQRITAETTTGQIIITAGKGLSRSYTWDGATRSAELWPRTKRWYGSLGAYFPGPGDHWKEHRGITRGVLEEGQQHFDSVTEAMKWLQQQRVYNANVVWRSDGLVVSFDRNLSRQQINVDVYQVLIGGQKPTQLPGSEDDRIKVSSLKEN